MYPARSEPTATAQSVIGELMSMDEIEPTEQSPDDLFLTAVLFESALGGVALLLGWALGPSARAMIPELEPENLKQLGLGLGFGCLAAIPVLALIELIRHIPWEPIRELERLTDDSMIKTLLKLRPSELIVISICAGIGEELLFRGWLMYWLDETAQAMTTSPPQATLIAALVVSSVVFGFFHPISRLYIFLATLMGFYFGALVIYTENLLVPITAHATYDAVQLIITARREETGDHAP